MNVNNKVAVTLKKSCNGQMDHEYVQTNVGSVFSSKFPAPNFARSVFLNLKKLSKKKMKGASRAKKQKVSSMSTFATQGSTPGKVKTKEATGSYNYRN